MIEHEYSPLQDRLLSLVHAFSDEQRKYAVRLLAKDVGYIERELNAAQALIRQQQLLDEENQRLKERVKRLEEVGDLCLDFSFRGFHVLAEGTWKKAKEAA